MPILTHNATWNEISSGTVTLTAVFQLEATGRRGDPTQTDADSMTITATI